MQAVFNISAQDDAEPMHGGGYGFKFVERKTKYRGSGACCGCRLQPKNAASVGPRIPSACQNVPGNFFGSFVFGFDRNPVFTKLRLRIANYNPQGNSLLNSQ